MQRLHRLAVRIAHFAAVAGGIVLCLLILMTCLSIIGRAANTSLHWVAEGGTFSGIATSLLDLGVGAIRGDFELVEAGLAFCIFAFLPLCQLTGAHATVDLIEAALPKGVSRWMTFVIEVIFAISLIVIAYQLKLGMESKLRSGQTSLLLQFPLWWGYAASLFGATLSATAGVVMAFLRLAEAVQARSLIIQTEGGSH